MHGLNKRRLLKLDRTASFFDLLFDRFSFFLVDAFLNCLQCSIDVFLSFLKTQARNFTYSLNYLDLLVTSCGENDIELSLLSFAAACVATTGSRCRNSNRSRCSYAELLFHLFNELGKFKYRHVFNRSKN